MNNRSYALVLNGISYSIFTATLIAASITTGNLNIINGAIVTFIIMTLSLLLSIIIQEENSEVSKGILVFSFILLLPLGVLVFMFTFLVSFTRIIFSKEKRGGDNDD